MKSKLLLLSIFVFTYSVLTAQVPQGINYQALALDSSNEPISNTVISVRLQILSALEPDVVEWHELHTGITTSPGGLFTLTLGEGLKQGTPNAATFSGINWSLPQLYLRTWITYQSTEHLMGTTRLLSVPYALAAGSVTGSLPRLQVEGVPSVTDDALFEVKNKEGKTVFAVYNQGVRVYVGSGETKAVKGGFAIGSFDETKGVQDYFVVNSDCVRVYLDNNTVGKAVKGGFAIGSFDETKGALQNYLRVTDDSIRMYIDDTPGKAVKGGFAIGSFDETKAPGKSYFNVATDAGGIVDPPQNRVLWYPIKNAFFAGQVLITDPVNVGTNSLSIGYETMAKGEYSQALGYKSQALRLNATAIGNRAKADGVNSFALGDSAVVTADDSYAIGASAVASGRGSFAIGSKDKLFGDNYTISTVATGELSMAIGLNAKTIGNESFAAGIGVAATGDWSVAIGKNSFAEGMSSLSVGGTASGLGSKTFGSGTASGISAIAIGGGTASGFSSAALFNGVASGSDAIALGGSSLASGNSSIALGRYTTAQAYGSTVIGSYNIISGNMISGISTDPIFVIGNGTYLIPSNALTVLRNGRTAIGHADPTQMLDVNGQVRIRGGSPAAGRVLTSAADGTATWQDVVIGTHSHSATEITSGTLSVARGGTATGTLSANKVMVGNGASAVLTPTNLHWDNTNSRLGIGTSAPSDHLHIANSSGNSRIRLSGTTGNSVLQYYNNTTFIGSVGANIDDGYLFIYQADNVSFKGGSVGIGNTNPGQKLDITNGYGRVSSGYSWLTNSDSRYKKNITTLAGSLDKVLAIRGVRYDLTDDSDVIAGSGRHIGFIAQELETQFPEFVVTDSSGYKSVAYDKMTAVLVEAIKDQQSEIETLRSELEALKALVNSMVSK